MMPRIVVVRSLLIEPENAIKHQRGAGDHEPGVDLLAFDDVAAFERLVEPLLGWVFCFVDFVGSSAMQAPRQKRGARSGSTPST